MYGLLVLMKSSPMDTSSTLTHIEHPYADSNIHCLEDEEPGAQDRKQMGRH